MAYCDKLVNTCSNFANYQSFMCNTCLRGTVNHHNQRFTLTLESSEHNLYLNTVFSYNYIPHEILIINISIIRIKLFCLICQQPIYGTQQKMGREKNWKYGQLADEIKWQSRRLLFSKTFQVYVGSRAGVQKHGISQLFLKHILNGQFRVKLVVKMLK